LIPIELCRRSGRWHVTAVDLAQAMLDVGATNVRSAGLADRITLQRLDAKELTFAGGSFDLVISNSILHHIPKPEECLAEMVRMVSPSGVLFVRDLLRPATAEELEQLVLTYAGNETEQQRGMFRDSLHAALSLEELRGIAAPLGVPASCIRQTTDRHWTLVWTRG
jgi:ubiquinone/menaquinone biosynthesis C-methylase UbiE